MYDGPYPTGGTRGATGLNFLEFAAPCQVKNALFLPLLVIPERVDAPQVYPDNQSIRYTKSFT